MTTPIVAAIDMGYGHLRPASALAEHLGTEVLHMELPPLGAEVDRRFWEWTREAYEPLTRFSPLPGLRQLLRGTRDPLPDELVGGRGRPVLKQTLAARLARIDRRGEFRGLLGVEVAATEETQAPLIVFAVGGAGAQVPLAKKIVQGMRKEIDPGPLPPSRPAGPPPPRGRPPP